MQIFPDNLFRYQTVAPAEALTSSTDPETIDICDNSGFSNSAVQLSRLCAKSSDAVKRKLLLPKESDFPASALADLLCAKDEFIMKRITAAVCEQKRLGNFEVNYFSLYIVFCELL